MSTPSQPDPRVDQPAMTDDDLLSVHEQVLGKQPDDKARYRLMPLNLLFLFSGLIFFSGTYLGRYAANFSPVVFDENAPPPKAPWTPSTMSRAPRSLAGPSAAWCPRLLKEVSSRPSSVGLKPICGAPFRLEIRCEWMSSRSLAVDN